MREKNADLLDSVAIFFSCLVSAGFLVMTFPPSSVYASSSFGVDYRHLTTVSPGSTPDTTTTVTIGSGITATFIVDPFTSGSTTTGSPSTSLNGKGWRTSGVVGSTIPAGTWTFSITTTSSSIVGVANAMVNTYSTDTLGGSVANIGSATGSLNVLASLLDQQQTMSFTTASSTDLTNRVLVVEYWIDVTSAPLLATTVTFNVASSQTVVLPSSSGTFYLGRAALFSIGETESVTASDTIVRSLRATRTTTDSGIVSDQLPSRSQTMSRAVSEDSGAVLIDETDKSTQYSRQVTQATGLVVSDSISSFAGLNRQVSETSGAIIADSLSRFVFYVHEVSEGAAIITDSLSRLVHLARQLSDIGGLFIDVVQGSLGAGADSPPTDDNGDDDEDDSRGRNSQRNAPPIFHSSYFVSHPLEKVVIESFLVLDSNEESVSSESANTELELRVKIRNQQQTDQSCKIVISIIDENDVVKAIIVLSGTIGNGEEAEMSESWNPSTPGTYNLRILVWNKLDSQPTPLINAETKSLVVV